MARVELHRVIPARGASRPAAAALVLACAALATACSGGAPAPAPPSTRPPSTRPLSTAPPATALPATAPTSAAPPSAAQAAAAAATRALAARYLAIAQAGNRRLEHDFDGLEGRDRGNLAAARADLRDAAATERLFDQRLLVIAFPPCTERIARLLFAANQARARLTDEAATATSLRQLRGYQGRLDAANRPVEDAVQVIRSQLDLPPAEAS